jgi:tRNA(Arg) A34 adenosine deaminase TadA
MCFGVIPWSGVRHLVCGARGEDAEAVGFDEGTKPAEWVRSLDERGITVERDVLRDEAASVLREYAERAVRSTTLARAARAETPSGNSSGCGNRSR